MDIDALLEAFQDFEKKGKKETCPVLEQFLCHVAKTGQPLISWFQFKSYFMFKLEKVMDDFHASTPDQRAAHNPNVEYIPFEEMKARILKIVDGYNGIPFTIQRLCELLMDPKHNYTGTDKFLRGLEKNVMVVSCVYPASEKNPSTTVNRMNGVMFSGNSPLYSGSRNINGPGTPRPLTRPKLSLSSSFSTNGLPDCPVGREPEAAVGESEEPHISSDSSQPEDESTPNPGSKHKHPEEDDNVHDADEQEVKRIKFEEEEMIKEEKEFSTQPLRESGDPEYQSETSCDTTCDLEPSSTKTEGPKREGDSPEIPDVHSDREVDAEDGPELTAAAEKSTRFEEDNVEEDNNNNSSSSSSSSLSDEQCPSSSKQLPSSPCSSPDLSTEGAADHSVSTDAVTEPGD